MTGALLVFAVCGRRAAERARQVRCGCEGRSARVNPTPPGSSASILVGNKGVTSVEPGSIAGLLLAVHDIDAARAELISHGVDVSEVFHDAGGSLGGGFIANPEARAPGHDPQGRSYASYASFSDPDGNGWLLQEITVVQLTLTDQIKKKRYWWFLNEPADASYASRNPILTSISSSRLECAI
jgi:hypothetical protein